MAKVLVSEENLTGIANSIRAKNGTTDKYKPSEMSVAIDNIQTGGGDYEYDLSASMFNQSGNTQYYYQPRFIFSIKKIPDLESNCSNISQMFYEMTSIEEVGNLSFPNNTSLYATFLGCYNLKKIGKLDICNKKNTNMSNTFSNCSGLTTLDVSGWDTSNVTNMSNTFSDCSGLTTLDVSGWDTSNVTNMSNTFSNCSGLTTLDVSGWDTSNVVYVSGTTSTDYYGTFSGCSNLKTLNVKNFDVTNVKDLKGMFRNCSSLTSLDLSGWNTSKITGMRYVFAGCSNLTSLNLTGWDGTNSNGEQMFSGCVKLDNESLHGITKLVVTLKGSGWFKTLKDLGLTKEQATVCASFDEWSTAKSNGWTTGY